MCQPQNHKKKWLKRLLWELLRLDDANARYSRILYDKDSNECMDNSKPNCCHKRKSGILPNQLDYLVFELFLEERAYDICFSQITSLVSRLLIGWWVLVFILLHNFWNYRKNWILLSLLFVYIMGLNFLSQLLEYYFYLPSVTHGVIWWKMSFIIVE